MIDAPDSLATPEPAAAPAPSPVAAPSPTAAAQAELDAIDADPKHAANNYLHPNHEAALEHKLALRRLILGEANRVVVDLREPGDPPLPDPTPTVMFTREDVQAALPSSWRSDDARRYEQLAIDGAAASPIEAVRLSGFLAGPPPPPERELDLDALWGEDAEDNIRLVNDRLTELKRLSPDDHHRLLPYVQRDARVAGLVLELARRGPLRLKRTP